jgi:predicted TIM-barrel fold metal-dependent hydrolase
MSDQEKWIRVEIERTVKRLTKPNLVNYFTNEAMRQHEALTACRASEAAQKERLLLLAAKANALEEEIANLKTVKLAMETVAKTRGLRNTERQFADAEEVLQVILDHSQAIMDALDNREDLQDYENERRGMLEVMGLDEHDWRHQHAWKYGG